jgi:hypothetical protein
MKMYRKRLDSLEALRMEKMRLRYERLHTKSSDLNPLAELGRNKVTGAASSGVVSTVMELMSAASPLATAMAIGKPLLKILGKRKSRARELRYAAGLPPKPSLLKKVLTDVAVSYIIGKGVQMAVASVGMYLRRRKANKLKKVLYR